MNSILLLLLFFAQGILIFTLLEIKEKLVEIVKQGEYEDYSDTTSYEEELVARNRDFDLRIERMMEEIKYGADTFKHAPTVAEVLEEGVYNIPHHEVNTYEDSGIEIAN